MADNMNPSPFLALSRAVANLKLALARIAQDQELRNQERALFGDKPEQNRGA